jgi:cell division protease FtsH
MVTICKKGVCMNKKWLKSAGIWAGILLVLMVTFRLLNTTAMPEDKSYPQMVSMLSQNTPTDGVQSIKIQVGSGGDQVLLKLKNGKKAKGFLPPDSAIRADFRTLAQSKNIPIDYIKPDNGGMLGSFVSVWLPLIMTGLLFFFMFRGIQSSSGKAFSFGKSKAKLSNDKDNPVTFADIAGAEEVKEECGEVIDFLKQPSKYKELGAKIPKGILMVGPPGTGKTLLARAIAGEASVPFFHMSGSDFVEMFVGVGASRVRDLFETARKNAPALVFIDEIDAVGRSRGVGIGGGNDEREQTLNQLLVEMDGFAQGETVIIIAATNRPDVLDKALLRPGRFDRQITVGLPDVKGREAILKVHTKKIPMHDQIDLAAMAKGTPGFSGAELANLVNEAALHAARRNGIVVTNTDFEQAKDKLLIGLERKIPTMPRETLEVTAFHETGHALVAYFLKSKEDVHKITIIPRGNALGVTSYLPKEDVYGYSKEELSTRVAFALGGRAAEELQFKHFTTGASNDIQQASNIARRMVCDFGMSSLGPIHFQASQGPWGDPNSNASQYSNQTAFQIDQEVTKIIETEYARAKQVLTDNYEVFVRMSGILLELETINAEEFIAIIEENLQLADMIARQQAQKSAMEKDLAQIKLDKETKTTEENQSVKDFMATQQEGKIEDTKA